MTIQHRDFSDWDRFTFARVRVITAIEDRLTEHQAAERLDMTYNGLRSVVDELKAMTGCGDLRELGRWWAERREQWLEYCRQQTEPPKRGRRVG